MKPLQSSLIFFVGNTDEAFAARQSALSKSEKKAGILSSFGLELKATTQAQPIDVRSAKVINPGWLPSCHQFSS